MITIAIHVNNMLPKFHNIPIIYIDIIRIQQYYILCSKIEGTLHLYLRIIG